MEPYLSEAFLREAVSPAILALLYCEQKQQPEKQHRDQTCFNAPLTKASDSDQLGRLTGLHSVSQYTSEGEEPCVQLNWKAVKQRAHLSVRASILFLFFFCGFMLFNLLAKKAAEAVPPVTEWNLKHEFEGFCLTRCHFITLEETATLNCSFLTF